MDRFSSFSPTLVNLTKIGGRQMAASRDDSIPGQSFPLIHSPGVIPKHELFSAYRDSRQYINNNNLMNSIINTNRFIRGYMTTHNKMEELFATETVQFPSYIH